MTRQPWDTEDPLLRGDVASALTLPAPGGDESVVRHILQTDERRSPYLSSTESLSVAKLFAGKHGDVWHTVVRRIQSEGLRWISRSKLLDMLKAGKDPLVKWPRRSDLLMAQQYVEESAEHLIDFRSLKDQPAAVVRAAVAALFSKGQP